MRLPTVTIADDSPRGFKIINKSDFDPEKHKLFRDLDAGSITSGAAQGTDGDPGDTSAPEPEKPPAAPMDPAKVDMSDIEKLTWPELRSKAAAVSKTSITTKEDALDAIRNHRAANGGAD